MTFIPTHKNFSLKFHIISLFTTLIIISGGLLGWYSYAQLSQSIINTGEIRFDHSSKKVVSKIIRERQHIHTMLKILSASQLTAMSDVQKKLDSLPVLSEMLKGAPSLTALFVAYPNNDFFLYKKTFSTAKVGEYVAPNDSFFMLTLRQSGKTTHHFYDKNMQMIKVINDPNYNLQAKQRPWYKLAKESDSFALTDAYLFHATQELGVTLSYNDKSNGAVIGADYTLASASNLLKEFKVHPSSQRILIDQRGKILAYQDTEALLSNEGKLDRLKSVAEMNQPIIAHAFNNYKAQKGNVLFSYNNEQWLGRVTPLSADNNIRLFQLVKTKELLSKAYQLRDQSIIIILLIILVTLPLAWYFASLLTAPIGSLVKDLEKIKNFDFSKQTNTRSPVKEITALINVTNSMKSTISHFQDLSASLVSKQSFDQLLNKISQECNNIPNSQGAIILLNNNNHCEIQHCYLKALSDLENEHLTRRLSELELSHTSLQRSLSDDSMPDNINQLINADLKKPDILNWQLIPMKNSTGKNIGAIAVLASQSMPLNVGKRKYAQAIASFSALAIQSQQLLSEQKKLLESFILLIAGAIDSKSPYTGGHCARVPELTKMLSKAACEDKQGDYKHFELTEDQWEELHIAAWLHDCGKIVTPEYIVDKATKLETIYDRINEIRMRFELLKSDAEKNYWQGIAEGQEKQQLALQRDQLLTQLDQEFEFVAQCNIGGEFMSNDKIERLEEIAQRKWKRTLNNKIGIAPHQATKIDDSPLPIMENLLSDKAEHLIEREHAELTEQGNEWNFSMETPEYRSNKGEIYNLSIKRGTLTEEDRFIINGHMVHTIVMLSKLPFPKHLQQIPTIAGGHHEKMDGTGYPRKIKAAELPVTARIMVVADIFEALTASDRPYKERKTLSQAIKIMSFMVKDDHIDPALFKLFLTSGVYLQYAQAFLLKEQIDEVDIDQYL